MPLLHLSLPQHRLLVGRSRLLRLPAPHHARLSVRAAAGASASAAAEAYVLPFPEERATHHRELAAAAAAVERACRLCVDVKRSLFSDGRNILEKNDQTPVTVADFGVQALVSLELQRLFPSIPLVAEEDSASLRSSAADDNSSEVLVEAIFSAVADKVSNSGLPLTQADVLRALDRGGKDAVSFGSNPATYWVLDPIDGTKGFLKGDDALYVVGLALVVNGKLAVGVMGCPNWTNDTVANEKDDSAAACNGRGILMVSHVGCGTWTRHLSAEIGQFTTSLDIWKRCFVDTCSVAHMARYCISDGQSWDMIPLSAIFSSTIDESVPRDEKKILILSVFWGRLVQVSNGSCWESFSFCPSNTADAYTQVLGSCCWGNMCAGSRRSAECSYFAPRSSCSNICDHQICSKIRVQKRKTSDWSGKPLDLAADLTSRRNIYPTGGILVTNGALHDKLVEMIAANHK
ncbi:hypothetical protein ACP70R_005583 [Stipagrostis hirtigluma subsp. patula]